MTYGEELVKEFYQSKSTGIIFHKVPMSREFNLFKYLKSVMKLLKIMHKEKFDIVWTYTSKGGVLGRITAKLIIVKNIFHNVHRFAFHEHYEKSDKMKYVFIEKIASLFCNKIITVREFCINTHVHQAQPPMKIK